MPLFLVAQIFSV
uniref:Uncharacterized protein n=1 Tax=Rhizophora mucronata TaxID=61149 RepID=A0A2P2MP14_RHIMU